LTIKPFLTFFICLIYLNWLLKSADNRHTLHGSPQTTTKYGMPAPVWGTVPILVVALSFVVVIVKLLSNMS